ncbi:MAG: transporter involved in cytochrome c biosis, ATPase component [Pseudomonadota bacterium]|jgi:ABC-type multidrug transport system ATPase subunit
MNMTGVLPEALLQAERLTFHFPHRALFTGWSAQFGAGLSLVRGGDGDGKSTLLRLLAGALVPQSGHLTLNGADLALHPLAYRAQVFWCDPADYVLDRLDDCAGSTGRVVIVAHHAVPDGVPLATLVDLPGDGTASS